LLEALGIERLLMYRPPDPSQITWALLDEVESDTDSSIEGMDYPRSLVIVLFLREQNQFPYSQFFFLESGNLESTSESSEPSDEASDFEFESDEESEESGQSDVEFDNYNPCGDPANSMVVINTIDMLAADLYDVAEISGRLNRVVPDYYGQV